MRHVRLLAFLRILLLLGLPGELLLAQPGPPQRGAGVAPLPAGLAGLLRPRPRERPAQEIQRLQAARAQWAGDSLGQLLVYCRLSSILYSQQQTDSAYRYMRLAWRAAGPAQQRAQPAEVMELANGLANYHHMRGAYDSALV